MSEQEKGDGVFGGEPDNELPIFKVAREILQSEKEHEQLSSNDVALLRSVDLHDVTAVSMALGAAADEIERLTDTVEMRDGQIKYYKAERDRLRAALERIIHPAPGTWQADIALKALAGAAVETTE